MCHTYLDCARSKGGPIVLDAKSTNNKKLALARTSWSPSKGVVNPAVASVRTHTAKTGPANGSNQTINNKICEFCASPSACAGDAITEGMSAAQVNRCMTKQTMKATCEGTVVPIKIKMMTHDHICGQEEVDSLVPLWGANE